MSLDQVPGAVQYEREKFSLGWLLHLQDPEIDLMQKRQLLFSQCEFPTGLINMALPFFHYETNHNL